MAIFLDDGLGGGSNSFKAKINSLTVRGYLTRYGFVINEEKSLWEPVQVITWLGTVFDTYQGFISVTDRRVSKLKSSIDLLRKDDSKIFKVRVVASVVGCHLAHSLRWKCSQNYDTCFVHSCKSETVMEF